MSNAVDCGEVSMFDSMQKDNGLTSIAYFSSLVVSLIAHTVIVVMLVVVPLCLIKGLPTDGMIAILFTPPVISKPNLQPPVSTGSPASRQKGEGSKVFRTEIPDNQMTEPNKIPDFLPPPSNKEIVLIGLDMPRGNSVGGTGLYSGLEGIVSSLIPENYVEEPLRQPREKKKPVQLGVLDPSRLLLKVPPVYPEHAIRTRVSGKVHLEAMIDEEGNVADIKVIEGHPLLWPAAVEAVKQWKYTPTILNGEPMQILGTIIINFKID